MTHQFGYSQDTVRILTCVEHSGVHRIWVFLVKCVRLFDQSPYPSVHMLSIPDSWMEHTFLLYNSTFIKISHMYMYLYTYILCVFPLMQTAILEELTGSLIELRVRILYYKALSFVGKALFFFNDRIPRSIKRALSLSKEPCLYQKSTVLCPLSKEPSFVFLCLYSSL